MEFVLAKTDKVRSRFLDPQRPSPLAVDEQHPVPLPPPPWFVTLLHVTIRWFHISHPLGPPLTAMTYGEGWNHSTLRRKEKGKHPVEDACLRIELTKRNYSSTAACAAVRTLLFCGLIGILVSLTLWHGKFLCFYIFSCSSNFIFPLLLSSSLNIQISHFFAPLTDFLYPDEDFIVLKK